MGSPFGAFSQILPLELYRDLAPSRDEIALSADGRTLTAKCRCGPECCTPESPTVPRASNHHLTQRSADRLPTAPRSMLCGLHGRVAS